MRHLFPLSLVLALSLAATRGDAQVAAAPVAATRLTPAAAPFELATASPFATTSIGDAQPRVPTRRQAVVRGIVRGGFVGAGVGLIAAVAQIATEDAQQAGNPGRSVKWVVAGGIAGSFVGAFVAGIRYDRNPPKPREPWQSAAR